jgi:signal transduction histidine kinase
VSVAGLPDFMGEPEAPVLLGGLRSHRFVHYLVIGVSAGLILFLYYGYSFGMNRDSWAFLDWFWSWIRIELGSGVRGLLMLFPILYATLMLDWRRALATLAVLLAAIAPFIIRYGFSAQTEILSFSILAVPPIVLVSLQIKLLADANERQVAEQKKKQSAEVIRQLILTQEAERKRISRELHDGVVQSLLFTATMAHDVLEETPPNDAAVRQKLEKIVSNSMDMVTETRIICQDLRPNILDNLGLVSAVKWLCEEFQNDTGIEVGFSQKTSVGNLTQEQSLSLFRVVQEALNNIRKHAGASRVRVAIIPYRGRLAIEIEDDGQGFTVGQSGDALAAQGRLGMLNMEQRARSVGGGLDVQSAAGRGTLVRISVPVTNETAFSGQAPEDTARIHLSAGTAALLKTARSAPPDGEPRPRERK